FQIDLRLLAPDHFDRPRTMHLEIGRKGFEEIAAVTIAGAARPAVADAPFVAQYKLAAPVTTVAGARAGDVVHRSKIRQLVRVCQCVMFIETDSCRLSRAAPRH